MNNVFPIEEAFRKRLTKMCHRGNISPEAMRRLALSKDPFLLQVYELFKDSAVNDNGGKPL